MPAGTETTQRIAAVSGCHWSDALRRIFGATGSQIGCGVQRVDAGKPRMALGTLLTIAGAGHCAPAQPAHPRNPEPRARDPRAT